MFACQSPPHLPSRHPQKLKHSFYFKKEYVRRVADFRQPPMSALLGVLWFFYFFLFVWATIRICGEIFGPLIGIRTCCALFCERALFGESISDLPKSVFFPLGLSVLGRVDSAWLASIPLQFQAIGTPSSHLQLSG